jgi:hypothetical protein
VASEDFAMRQRFDLRPPHAPHVTSFHCKSFSTPLSASKMIMLLFVAPARMCTFMRAAGWSGLQALAMFT